MHRVVRSRAKRGRAGDVVAATVVDAICDVGVEVLLGRPSSVPGAGGGRRVDVGADIVQEERDGDRGGCGMCGVVRSRMKGKSGGLYLSETDCRVESRKRQFGVGYMGVYCGPRHIPLGLPYHCVSRLPFSPAPSAHVVGSVSASAMVFSSSKVRGPSAFLLFCHQSRATYLDHGDVHTVRLLSTVRPRPRLVCRWPVVAPLCPPPGKGMVHQGDYKGKTKESRLQTPCSSSGEGMKEGVGKNCNRSPPRPPPHSPAPSWSSSPRP